MSRKKNQPSVESQKSISLRTFILPIIIVSAAVLAAHWPALFAQAVSFDDDQYFTENVLIQNPGWNSARRFITEVFKPSTVKGYYQPLTMLSLMLDYVAGGRQNNLLPCHRTNLALHIANTALVIVLLYLLFENIWAAAAAGLLFGVHPMTVEPIPWLGERKTLLAAFFALWCLIFYIRYAGTAKRRFYAAAIVTYALALLSKPTSTTLPAVLFLMDYWPLNRLKAPLTRNLRQAANLIVEKLPFFAIGGISAVITYISQMLTVGHAQAVENPLSRSFLVICHDIVFYIYKIAWPVNLSSHYAFPNPMALSNPSVLAGVIGSALLIPLLLFSLRWSRAPLTGWLIFFIAILPTLQIIGFSNVIASDKFAYLPSVGLLMVLCWALTWLLKKGRTLTIVVTAVVLTLAAAESFATRSYLRCWKDSVTLFEHMLSLTPNAAPVHNFLGIALQNCGRLDQAVAHYRRAIELDPLYNEAYNNLAGGLLVQRKFDDAIICCRKAIQLRPEYAHAYSNIGLAFQAKGKLDDALDNFLKAVKIKPDHPDFNYNVATVFQTQGKFDKAAEYYQNTVRLRPEDAEAHYNLANVLKSLSRYNEAETHYRRALQLAISYGNNQLAADVRKQLELYQHKKP
jgi:Flp pilus assembly protein TadD